jgi:hypothetical protein
MASAVTVSSASDSGEMRAPTYKSPGGPLKPTAKVANRFRAVSVDSADMIYASPGHLKTTLHADAAAAARCRAAAPGARRRSHRGDAAHRVVTAPASPVAPCRQVTPGSSPRLTTWRRKVVTAAPTGFHPVTPPSTPPKAPPPSLSASPVFMPPEPPERDDDYWGHFLDLDPAEEQNSYRFSHTRHAL